MSRIFYKQKTEVKFLLISYLPSMLGALKLSLRPLTTQLTLSWHNSKRIHEHMFDVLIPTFTFCVHLRNFLLLRLRIFLCWAINVLIAMTFFFIWEIYGLLLVLSTIKISSTIVPDQLDSSFSIHCSKSTGKILFTHFEFKKFLCKFLPLFVLWAFAMNTHINWQFYVYKHH